MSIDDVQDLAPRVRCVASASQDEFDYPFPVFQAADLVVLVDDVEQVLTTDYTVDGEGEDLGGTVTFVVPMVGGEVVTIYRDTVIERNSDVQQNGPIASSTFNDEFDKAYTIMQELKAKIGRAIRFPFTAAISDTQTELSPLSNWLDKFLYISSAGILEAASIVSSVVPLTQSLIGQLLNPQTAAELFAGVTPTNYQYPELDARRYGVTADGTTDDTLALQAAINLWVTRDSGDLILPAGTIRTTDEIVVNFSIETRNTARIIGYGTRIAPSATIDSGNGYALKVTRAPLVLVRNKTFEGFQVWPTAGDCGGIEIDGRSNNNGYLYGVTFRNVHVFLVTRHGIRMGGNFFESNFDACSVRIDSNEAGYHGVLVDLNGNDDADGDISSIELRSCNISGGENNVNFNGAGDELKIIGGTYLLSGKEAIKGSTSGHLECPIIGAHFENAWSGPSAVKSASWIATTNQAVVSMVGRLMMSFCHMVSSTDACRQMVHVYSANTVHLLGLTSAPNGSGDFQYVCRIDGAAGARALIESCECTQNGVAVLDENVATNVQYAVRNCPGSTDRVSVRTFTAADTTPSVRTGTVFLTSTTGVTITDFDDAGIGTEITVISNGATTFDTTGTNLVGSSVDIVTAAGDVTKWVKTGTTWKLVAFVDASVDNSAGA